MEGKSWPRSFFTFTCQLHDFDVENFSQTNYSKFALQCELNSTISWIPYFIVYRPRIMKLNVCSNCCLITGAAFKFEFRSIRLIEWWNLAFDMTVTTQTIWRYGTFCAAYTRGSLQKNLDSNAASTRRRLMHGEAHIWWNTASKKIGFSSKESCFCSEKKLFKIG